MVAAEVTPAEKSKFPNSSRASHQSPTQKILGLPKLATAQDVLSLKLNTAFLVSLLKSVDFLTGNLLNTPKGTIDKRIQSNLLLGNRCNHAPTENELSVKRK